MNLFTGIHDLIVESLNMFDELSGFKTRLNRNLSVNLTSW